MALVNDPASDLPEAARQILVVLVENLRALNKRVAKLDQEIRRRAKDPVARRLMTIPGVGVAITATAMTALAPAAETFKRGRDFAAWVGLTPLQRSTGGMERLGRTSRMGGRTLRRLLIIGASAVARWASRKGAVPGAWRSGWYVASRRCWSEWLWPTRWRARLGLCSLMGKFIGLRSRLHKAGVIEGLEA